MAEFTVKQVFADKNTQMVYQIGDKYSDENVTEKRLAELLGDVHPFHTGALIVRDEPAVEPEKPTSKSTVQEIESHLDDSGIDHSGVTKKADLLDLV